MAFFEIVWIGHTDRVGKIKSYYAVQPQYNSDVLTYLPDAHLQITISMFHTATGS